jgi:hypothetical protein
MKRFLLLMLTLCLSTIINLGQSTSGKIVGSVVAPDGAVPGATIVVTDNQTGKERTVVSSSEGTFEVSQLEFGVYTVKITASGYKTFTATEVKIDAGREYSLTAQLEVGQVTEQVTVTGGAEQVNSSNGELSTTVSPQQIKELPLNGRNPLSLLNLQAGVNVTSGSINGQRSSSVNYTRDGLNVQDNFIRNGFVSDQPTVDDTGEFNVITQNAGAEFGSGSTQVLLVTPRGGNEFHGALYAFNRNSKFAANNFNLNRTTVNRPFLNRNQFGGSFSGPLPFPGFNEGGPFFVKDKVFFFVNYEGFRLANQVGASGTTLLPQARNGNFTYTDNTGVVRTINVLSGQGLDLTTAANQTAFNNSGGVFTVSPIIQARVLDRLPTAANGTTTGTNFLQVVNFLRANPEERNQWASRVDADINDQNSINFVYKRNNIIDARTDLASGFTTDRTFASQGGPTNFFVGAWRITPKNNFSNEFRAGFQYSEPFFFGNEIPTDYLLALPLITNPEASFRDQGRNTLYRNFQDNAVYTIGSHSLRFGAQAQFYKFTATNFAGVTPTYTISTTANTNTPRLAAGLFPGGINATDRTRADNLRYLLAGIIGAGAVNFNIGDTLAGGYIQGLEQKRTLNFETYSGYISDQWRVTPNLSLNLGVRYEYYTPLNDPRGLYLEGRVTNFDNPVADVINPSGVYQLVGGNAGHTGDFFRADKNNFAPNISFAYSPKFENGFFSGLLGSQTVIRGGFKINYVNDEYVRSADNALLNNAGLGTTSSAARRANGSTSLRSSLTPIAGFETLPGFTTPAVRTPPFTYESNNTSQFSNFGTVSIVDPNLQIQKNYEYNLGIQREVGFGTVLELRYVGGFSNQLVRSIDYNQINIRDSGFLADFLKAQNNCRLQGATLPANGDTRDSLWRCTTAAYNPAIAGSQPLTTFNNLAGAGLLNDPAVVPFIQNGTPSDLALLYLQNNLEGTVGLLANPNTGVANYTTNGGKYIYNALQAELRRRFNNGFSYQANYTFQKILTDIGTPEDDQTRVAAYLDNAEKGRDYARAYYDRTHTFNFNAIYELPFGKGKKFLNEGGWVDKVFGGFQISSIITLSSGVPLTITDARGTLNRAGRSALQPATTNLTSDELKELFGVFKTPNGVYAFNPAYLYATGSNGQRIDLTQPLPAGVTISSVRAASTIDQTPFAGQVLFFNKPGSTGNLPRYFINGPKYINWDAGLSKNIRFTETMRLQLRAEVFNVLNRANFFAGQSFDISSSNFGLLPGSGNVYAPRVMQFGARFDF